MVNELNTLEELEIAIGRSDNKVRSKAMENVRKVMQEHIEGHKDMERHHRKYRRRDWLAV